MEQEFFQFGKDKTFPLIPFSVIPYLRKIHGDLYTNTRIVESIGQALVQSDHVSQNAAREFVEKVADWGGPSGRRNVTRVLDRNDGELARYLDEAIRHGKQKAWNAGIEAILKIEYVGFSYATKYMRFLFPNDCVVLDSKISEYLGWELSLKDYEKWSARCKIASSKLGIPCSDVEAGIFALIRIAEENGISLNPANLEIVLNKAKIDIPDSCKTVRRRPAS